jgi:hypothetical protein
MFYKNLGMFSNVNSFLSFFLVCFSIIFFLKHVHSLKTENIYMKITTIFLYKQNQNYNNHLNILYL